MKSPEITIKRGSGLPFDKVIALYQEVGWTGYMEEPIKSKLSLAIHNSSYMVTAWKGDI